MLGFKKKVKKQMSYRGNEIIQLWMRPMVTHMYHCVKKCIDPELLKARWLSMERHMTNEVCSVYLVFTILLSKSCFSYNIILLLHSTLCGHGIVL